MLSCCWTSSGLATFAPARDFPSEPSTNPRGNLAGLPGDPVSTHQHQRHRTDDESPADTASGRQPLTERESRTLPRAPPSSVSGPSEKPRSRRRAPASEPCSDRASVPTPPPLGNETGRCSPGLSPSEAFHSTVGPKPSPLALSLRPPPNPLRRTSPAVNIARHPRVSNSRDWRRLRRAPANLHEVFDLIRASSALDNQTASCSAASRYPQPEGRR